MKKYSKIIAIIVVVITFFNLNIVNAQQVEKIANENVENAENVNVAGKNNTQNEEGIFDTKVIEGVYKTSDENEKYLPFIRIAVDRIIVDSEKDGLGIMFSGTNIDIDKPLKGLHVLFANDTVRVNSDLENAIIFANNNVVIDGVVEKPIVVIAGQTITISETAEIKKDIICLSNTLNINGKVNGSILGSAITTNVNGNIQKDLRMQTNEINFKDEKNVLGNVFVSSINDLQKIKEKYPNAIIKMLNIKENKFNYTNVINIIMNCLIFTLIYIIINKISKENDIIENTIKKMKNNSLFVILSGSIVVLVIPMLIMMLFILSLVGLYQITIPILVLYLAFLIIVTMLSKLIVGSIMSKYMSTHYFNDKTQGLKNISSFFVFLSLYIVCKIPFIGYFANCFITIIALGIVLLLIFKKEKITEDSKIVDDINKNN